MDWKVIPTGKPETYELVIKGSIRIETAYKACEEFIVFMKDRKLSNILINLTDSTNSFSIMDEFTFGKKLVSIDYCRVKMIALFEPKRFQYLDMLLTAAYNRGLDIKAFNSKRDALAWLAPPIDKLEKSK